jgi:hypothetical protein
MSPALAVLGPFFWDQAYFWSAIPISVITFLLLPLAYVTFLLMMNNRHLMGKEILVGGKRTFINILLVTILIVIALVAGWAIWNKVRWIGVGIVAVFIGLAVIVHFVRPPKKSEVEPQPKPTGVH